MFYRQKILVALLEIFGGSLPNTDLEKLLFLYCQSGQENHYSFFPYKFGAFSFESYDDRRKLIGKGVLKDVPHFEIQASQGYLGQLKKEHQIRMRAFSIQMQSYRGRELVKYSYVNYPKHAARSEIANQLLSRDEYNAVQRTWNIDDSPTLFTIGYEGATIDNYLNRLIQNNVKLLIDVRKNPISRKHGFSKQRFKGYLEKVDIPYIHLPELGIPSKLRKELGDKASYNELFEHYAHEILPHEESAIESIYTHVARSGRVAITCFEAEHKMCHRHKISEIFEKDTQRQLNICHI